MARRERERMRERWIFLGLFGWSDKVVVGESSGGIREVNGRLQVG